MTKPTVAQLKKWQSDPTVFIETQLIDPVTLKPFQLLPAQRAFIEHAFRIDQKTGRLRYPEMVFSCGRKGGKTGFAGLMMLTMVLLYGGRFAEGYCVANDFEQAQGRVFAAISKMVECSPLFRGDAVVQRDKIVFKNFGDAFISAIASDAASAAGHNASFVTFDELWGVVSERGRRLWDEMSTSPVRKISARLTTTYAGYTGESELLEELYKRGLQQPQIGKDLHAGDGILCFWTHEPIAPWQTQAWIDEQRRSLRPNQYLRQVENRWVDSEAAFIDLAKWDACVDPDARPFVFDESLPIWVGVDASVKHDSTGIAAATWDTSDQKVRLVFHRIFQPSPDRPLDFESTIEETILDLNDRFSLRKVLCDPFQMASTMQRLSRAGISIEEYPQSSPNLTAASQNLFDLINGRNLIAYPSDELRLAISRAVAAETSRGWRITKDKQSHKIDVVVALGMACHAAVAKGESVGVRWFCGDPGINDYLEAMRKGQPYDGLDSPF
jgi:phage terminase large subunit-like protein